MKIKSIVCCALACLLFSGVLQAHHSDRMIDSSTTTWITGTVVSYALKNPHAMIELDVVAEDGQSSVWTIEGPRLLRVENLGLEGDMVQVGDIITICGFHPVSGTTTRTTRPRYIHGKILVRPDGQKWAWGPYGRLKNCISEDEWDTIESGSNPLRP